MIHTWFINKWKQNLKVYYLSLEKNSIVLGGIFDTDVLTSKLDDLKAQTEKSDFWSDVNSAKKIMQKISELEEKLKLVDDITEGLNDISEFHEIAIEESDSDSIKEYSNDQEDEDDEDNDDDDNDASKTDLWGI